MSIEHDQIQMTYQIEGDSFRGAQDFQSVLEHLQNSFLSPPVRIESTDHKIHDIKGYFDPKVAKALDRKRYVVELINEQKGFTIHIHQGRSRSILGISFSTITASEIETEEIRNLFVKLTQLLSPTYAFCHLDKHSRILHEKFYRTAKRTFFADGLYWLNFFGPEEEALQGGSALEENPYAKVERTPQGLILQVGDDPLKSETPEGEQRLVAATKAMPSTKSSKIEQSKQELITISGVRGFIDLTDKNFWVAKNLAANAKLSAKILEKLKNLIGKGEPPVSKVQVLFSRQETAEKNHDKLAKNGIGTWYIDLQTGQPREVK